MDIFTLLFLSSIIITAHAEDSVNSFIVDVIAEFRLTSPTIIFVGDVPPICMETDWSLCIENSQNDAALISKHLETLHLSRKQDGVIFADGGNGMTSLIEEISHLTPSLFRSPCPFILPLAYSDFIKLRLDSNLLFYKKESNHSFMLIDMYTFKVEPTITKELGLWNKRTGLELYASINRWNRRTDLKGGMLINTLKFYKNRAEPIFDSQGKVISTKGSMQDMLYTIAERLNLTIVTVITADGQFGRLLDNRTWTGCVGMVTRNDADICSVGLAWSKIRGTAIDFVETPGPRGSYTLIGKGSKGNILDMWVYVSVFGIHQLGVFAALLLAILLGYLLTQYLICSNKKDIADGAASGLGMIFLFTIQLGIHPQGGPYTIRMLYLILSILTFIMFAYFTTIVTAQMTSLASLDNPINTFNDVLKDEEIQVIVINGSSWTTHLQSSAPGTAKYEVYKNRIENNGKAWFKKTDDALDAVRYYQNTYLYSHSSAAKTKPGIIALRMSDSTPTVGGLGIQKNSDLLDILNYHMLRLYENGIIERIVKKWPEMSRNEEFEMAEPGGLAFNNVLFPFTILAIGIITAMVFSLLEFIIKKVSYKL